MNKRNAAETKARILSTAEKIFSEVGFDSARVDDIAKEAGVNKALIYYYFESKNQILDMLFSALIDEIKQVLIQKTVAGTPEIQDNIINGDYRPLIEAFMDFMSRKRKIIKIVIGESVKASTKLSMVMKVGTLIIDGEIESIRKAYESKGLHFSVNKQEFLVTEFFTGFMPLISYALYGDEWQKIYHISEKDLREQFYQSFKKTHLAAHCK
jgi:TetR/AcrR family transcriptional regulator